MVNRENIYLLGYGKTTKAIVEKFGVDKIYDDRKINEAIHSSQFPKSLKSGDIFIPTPAIPPYHSIVKQFEENLISEYDLYYRYSEFPYSIWVSGTNGKTTTTEMITHLLKDRYAESGGNIGTPLGVLNPSSSIWVLETSSFMLHYTKYAKPNLYVLLPITPDHENWHNGFDNYEESKLKPIYHLLEGEVAIVPEKYKDIDTEGYLITYRDSSDLAQKFGFDLEKIEFSGGFLLDAILALAVKKILFDEVDYQKINSFQRSAHRQEAIQDSKNRIWINDSKATNPSSTISMVQSIPKEKRFYLILGGEDKGADWNEMFKLLSKYRVKIFAIGKNSLKVVDLANSYKLESVASETLFQAVQDISLELQPDELAVLSPASASFDQFRSYVDRGEQFKTMVKELYQTSEL